MLPDYKEELSSILIRITEMGEKNTLDDFWRILEVRSEETAQAWRNHIEQGTEIP